MAASSVGTKTTASGRLAKGLADQRLLLADVVGRLGHVVDRPRAGLGRHPVGGQPGGRIGRIDPVLGEDGKRAGLSHGLHFGIIPTRRS
jgi:hypothetical protein